MTSRSALPILLLSIVTLTACRTAGNYTDPAGPRYAPPVPTSVVPGDSSLRVVSFNVQFGREIDRALNVLRDDPDLQGVDVLLLQEMDADGVRRIARALDMGFVYYPASRDLGNGRDFGNAVLSRWPIVDDAKILLPGIAPFGRRRRTATAATLQIGDVQLRVYSVHLGTLVNVGPVAQRLQFDVVLADAARYRHVVLGGDLNTSAVGGRAVDRGFAWPTKDGPPTLTWGRWDHIFFKGLDGAGPEATGTVMDVRGASDHRPVWADAHLPSG